MRAGDQCSVSADNKKRWDRGTHGKGDALEGVYAVEEVALEGGCGGEDAGGKREQGGGL